MKLAEIQQIENDLISGKLGSESKLFTDFISKTRDLLGIKPTTENGIEKYNTKIKNDLDSVLVYISRGETITGAVEKSGLNSVNFFGKLSTEQMQQIQVLRSNFKLNGTANLPD